MLVVKEKYYIAFLIITICFNVYVLRYLTTKHSTSCDCAKDFRRDLIRYYLMFALCVSSFVVLSFFFMNHLTFKRIMNGASVVLIPSTLAYLFILYQYISILDKRDCTCVDHVDRIVVKFVTGLVAGAMSLNGLIFVLGILGWVLLKKS